MLFGKLTYEHTSNKRDFEVVRCIKGPPKSLHKFTQLWDNLYFINHFELANNSRKNYRS